MPASIPRRFPGVTLVTLLALAAGPARAGDARGTFTVSATVVRSVAVRTAARSERGALRIEAVADRGARGGAGVQIAAAGEPGGFTTGAASLSTGVAGDPGRVVVVTVLPDGRPPAIRLRD